MIDNYMYVPQIAILRSPPRIEPFGGIRTQLFLKNENVVYTISSTKKCRLSLPKNEVICKESY